MRHSLKIGLCFGSTSGIITTIGLIVGLHSGTHSQPAIIGGILTIAVADAFSDALGIHITEESKKTQSSKEVWESTLWTFLAKFIFALSFFLPIFFLPLFTAIVVGVIWGLLVLSILSFMVAKENDTPAWKVVLEHLFIAGLVITATHFIGDWINYYFIS